MVSSFHHSLTHLTQRWTRPMQINTLLKAMVSGSINIYLYSIYPNKITRYLSWVFATQLDPAIGSWDILEVYQDSGSSFATVDTGGKNSLRNIWASWKKTWDFHGLYLWPHYEWNPEKFMTPKNYLKSPMNHSRKMTHVAMTYCGAKKKCVRSLKVDKCGIRCQPSLDETPATLGFA